MGCSEMFKPMATMLATREEMAFQDDIGDLAGFASYP
jgi:hypothetical protein